MENFVSMYNPITNIIIPRISGRLKYRWEEMGFVEVGLIEAKEHLLRHRLKDKTQTNIAN